MNILLDPRNNPAEEFLTYCKIPRWLPQPPLRQITKSVITWKVYNVEAQFFPRSMFSMVRNTMKLSFAFYDLSNYLKIQNGHHFWDFTLIHEALYFFLDPCFQGYGMQWSYNFCSTITATTSDFCGSFKLMCHLFTRSFSKCYLSKWYFLEELDDW